MTETKILFLLEDSAEREAAIREKWNYNIFVANSTAEAIRMCESDGTTANLILLDHDLGNQRYQNPNEFNCGTTFAKYLSWLANDVLLLPEDLLNTPIIIHSMNIEAAKTMLGILRDARFTSLHIIPYNILINNWDELVSIAK